MWNFQKNIELRKQLIFEIEKHGLWLSYLLYCIFYWLVDAGAYLKVGSSDFVRQLNYKYFCFLTDEGLDGMLSEEEFIEEIRASKNGEDTSGEQWLDPEVKERRQRLFESSMDLDKNGLVDVDELTVSGLKWLQIGLQRK